MLEHERDLLLQVNDGTSRRKKKNGINDEIPRHREDVDLWMKYVLCFEMLEMETELHLVEQVWMTVAEITSEIQTREDGDLNLNDSPILQSLPRPTWDDVGSLLRLVLVSELPMMRKLGLFRFLSGHTGVETNSASSIGIGKQNEDSNVFMNRPKDKGNTKKYPGGRGNAPVQPLSVVSVDFVINVVMRSYNSIVGTKVGENMQIEEEGKQERVSISDLLSSFLFNYTISLAMASTKDGAGATWLSEFVNLVVGPTLIQSSSARSLKLYYRSVASALDALPSTEGQWMLNLDPNNIQAAIWSMRAIFSPGGAPKAMQDGLRLDLALVLKSSMPWNKVAPSVILQILAMYSLPEVGEAEDSSLSKARAALAEWLAGFDDGGWVRNASSACASAFVSGQLMYFGDMDVMSGVNSAERDTGMSVCVFCSLSGGGSEVLWPAVFKGLQNPTAASSSSAGFCKANRSMILLEFGCKEGILSGMGNGDILLGKSNRFMIPPTPNIESFLGRAAQFIMSQLTSMSATLYKTDAVSGTSGGSTRSSTSNSASAYIAILIGQLRVLHLSYPSSIVLSQAVDIMLENCVKSLIAMERKDINNSESPVKVLTLCYAALSCGASFVGDKKLSRLISTCRTILNVELALPPGMKYDAKQACRSIFQLAKW